MMNNSGIPEAKCPNCGERYFGWAMLHERYPKCKKCGAKLEMVQRKKVRRS